MAEFVHNTHTTPTASLKRSFGANFNPPRAHTHPYLAIFLKYAVKDMKFLKNCGLGPGSRTGDDPHRGPPSDHLAIYVVPSSILYIFRNASLSCVDRWLP